MTRCSLIYLKLVQVERKMRLSAQNVGTRSALKFAFGAPSLLSSMTKLQGSSTLLHGLSDK